MLHEEFAERVAERLNARADGVESEGWLAGPGVTAVRVRELRVAAEIAREEAATVTLEEAPPPEAQASDLLTFGSGAKGYITSR
jgi:hypothetical protein